MAWLHLLIAACFEIGFTTFMKLAHGDWKSPWQFPFVACAVLSFIFLEQAARNIPLGVAYAAWTGIGATGTILIGTLVFGEKLSLIQGLLLCNLIFSIVALKIVNEW